MSVILKNSPREKLLKIVKHLEDDLTFEAQSGVENARSRLQKLRACADNFLSNPKFQLDCLDCTHAGFFIDVHPAGDFDLQLGVCQKWTIAHSRPEGPPQFCTLAEAPEEDEEPRQREDINDSRNHSSAIDLLNKLAKR